MTTLTRLNNEIQKVINEEIEQHFAGKNIQNTFQELSSVLREAYWSLITGRELPEELHWPDGTDSDYLCGEPMYPFATQVKNLSIGGRSAWEEMEDEEIVEVFKVWIEGRKDVEGILEERKQENLKELREELLDVINATDEAWRLSIMLKAAKEPFSSQNIGELFEGYKRDES